MALLPRADWEVLLIHAETDVLERLGVLCAILLGTDRGLFIPFEAGAVGLQKLGRFVVDRCGRLGLAKPLTLQYGVAGFDRVAWHLGAGRVDVLMTFSASKQSGQHGQAHEGD